MMLLWWRTDDDDNEDDDDAWSLPVGALRAATPAATTLRLERAVIGRPGNELL